MMSQFTSHMDIALDEARLAAARGEVPVGAVVVSKGKVIVQMGNRTRELRDPTAHAEMLAIRAACAALGQERLGGCDLYVTLEPCPMCAAAISNARIARLYYGASDPKSGGVAQGAKVFSHPQCHHVPEVYDGIDEAGCAEVLRVFFAGLRKPASGSVNWKIRKAKREDASALAACIDRAYSVYASRINDLPAVSEGLEFDIVDNAVWIAEDDGEIVGGLVLVLHPTYATLANIAVDPSTGGTGLGKALIERAEDACRKLKISCIKLSTHIKMPENVSFYEHLGWHVINHKGNKVMMEKVILMDKINK